MHTALESTSIPPITEFCSLKYEVQIASQRQCTVAPESTTKKYSGAHWCNSEGRPRGTIIPNTCSSLVEVESAVTIADESKAVISPPSSWRCCWYARVIADIYLKGIRLVFYKCSMKSEPQMWYARSIFVAVAFNISFQRSAEIEISASCKEKWMPYTCNTNGIHFWSIHLQYKYIGTTRHTSARELVTCEIPAVLHTLQNAEQCSQRERPHENYCERFGIAD